MGYIYILTNPSFPEYVKIGYADNVEDRVAQLNRTECTPFAFRIFATYKVSERLKDIPVHELIDSLNPSLRSIDHVDGKERKREFYAMSADEAYGILQKIAIVNGLEGNLKYYSKSSEEIAEELNDEKQSEEIRKLSKDRHHFKEIDFTSSLTGLSYHGCTNENGTLSIVDLSTGIEVPNNSKPSKKQIIRRAIEDLNVEVDNSETLYQMYRKLSKIKYN